VSAGCENVLALSKDRILWSWGSNQDGQLGVGNYTNSEIPIKISTLSNIKSIHAGGYHCLTVDGNYLIILKIII